MENQYKIYKKYAVLVIYSEKHGTFNIKIDLDDVEKCKRIVWSINVYGNNEHSPKKFYYAVNGKKGLLHRFICGTPKGYVTDHIDLDTMNNRKKNLRTVTRSQNSMNREMQLNNKSGHNGVIWVERFSKWMAHIRKSGVQTNLGYYEDINEAVKVRRDAEKTMFGKYGRKSE